MVTFENSLGHVSYFNNLSSDNATEVFTSSSVFLEGIVCEGISSTDSALELETFKAFPNPGVDQIQIQFDDAIGLELIEIYNQFGQLVSQIYPNEGSSIISKSDIGSGLFIVRGKNKASMEIINPIKIIMH